MSLRVPSHLYRNRHGTFYFRHVLPPHLRTTARRREVRLSLGTEAKALALNWVLPLIGAIPELIEDLQQMSDRDETAPSDYFTLWREQVAANALLRGRIAVLKADVRELKDQLEDSTNDLQQKHRGELSKLRGKAKRIARQALTLGEKRGLVTVQESRFPPLAEKTILFSELTQKYLDNRAARPTKGVKKAPTPKTQEAYAAVYRLFVQVMTDMHIGAIDKEVAAAYFMTLRRLPANMNKIAKFKGKSITDILAMKPEPMSERTACTHMERISSVFTWALEERRKWGIDANPFKGYGFDGTGESGRRPFEEDELRRLFTHESYQERRFTSAYSFWMIPLALFTGARQTELAQLEVADFIELDGIHCINITDAEGPKDKSEKDDAKESEAEGPEWKRRLKTKNARRLVPIHPELLRMGLIEYVQALREAGEARAFPDLSLAGRDGPGQVVSRWFQRFRKSIGDKSKQETVFHSFRNTFITRVRDNGISSDDIAPIVGHEADLITGQVYWNKHNARARLPAVLAFELPAEVLALFPNYSDVRFVGAPGRRPGVKRKAKPPAKPTLT
jgi:integrase